MAAISDQIDKPYEQDSIFKSAIPYGVGTLATAGTGLYCVVTHAGAATLGPTAALVSGVALGLIGAYAFYGVIATATTSNNSAHFKERVWQGMATGVSFGIAETVRIALQAIVNALVQKAVFGDN